MAKIVQLRDRETSEKQYPVTIPQAVVDEAGRNIMEIIETYFKDSYTEADVMYGVEWDVTVADPAMTRIGNMALHRQLPIQNRMKGCLLDDDGNVVEYLPVTSWEGATLDGSRGQVMVELPEHYRKFETDGNIRRAKISEYPLPGYHVVPKMYISAYEATLQRSTNKLCSVKNLDPDYRGGDNNAEWDGTNRSLLGKPVTYYTRSQFRPCARSRNDAVTAEWNILDYSAYKALVWLYYIEYANRNSQLAFNAERDSNGYRQGGLGPGATTASSALLSYFNENPILNVGITDNLGAQTGVTEASVATDDSGNTILINVARYRGVENPFGHIWKISDGVVVYNKANESVGQYTSNDPSLYNDGDVSAYSFVGQQLNRSYQGFAKTIRMGEGGDIFSEEGGGGSSTFWADYHYLVSVLDYDTYGYMNVGGGYVNGVNAGLTCVNEFISRSVANRTIGTRLCFIPQN